LWEFLKKFEKTKRRWPPCDKVFSKSPMIVSNPFANLTRWFQQARKSNSGD
jgi:hypothetical protein